MKAYPLLATSLALAACGGGGGSGGDNDTPPPAVGGAVAISTGNYVQIAQETWAVGNNISDVSQLIIGTQTADSSVIVRFGKLQLMKLGTRLSGSITQFSGAVETQVEPCDGGGTLTVKLNDANNNGNEDPGDSAALSAANCIFDGQTLNGDLEVMLTSVSGNTDTENFSIGGILKFRNFRTSFGTTSYSAVGDINLKFTSRSWNDQVLELATSSFAVDSIFNGGAKQTSTLTDYVVGVNVAPSGSFDYTIATSVNGKITLSAWGGKSVDLTTLTAFTSGSSDLYPSVGQAVLTGAANSKVRITALGSSNVRLELDEDGNSVYEATADRPWSDLS